MEGTCCADGCGQSAGTVCVVCQREFCAHHIVLMDDFPVCCECDALHFLPELGLKEAEAEAETSL